MLSIVRCGGRKCNRLFRQSPMDRAQALPVSCAATVGVRAARGVTRSWYGSRTRPSSGFGDTITPVRSQTPIGWIGKPLTPILPAAATGREMLKVLTAVSRRDLTRMARQSLAPIPAVQDKGKRTRAIRREGSGGSKEEFQIFPCTHHPG